MATTSWKSPGTATNDSSVGNAAWSNVNNVLDGSNSTEAQTASMGASQTSQILRVTNFGFGSDIPEGSTILGIEVRYTRQRVQTGGNQVRDLSFRLRKSTGLVGADQANTGTNWPNNLTEDTRGAEDDLWLTSWTRAEVADSGFGMELRAQRQGGTVQGGVGYIQIRIHYDEPAAEPAEGSGIAELVLSADGAGQAVHYGHGEAELMLGAGGAGEAPASAELSYSNVLAGVASTLDADEPAEGGGIAELVLSAEGAGQAIHYGSGEATLTLSAEGAGQAIHYGSGEAALTLSAEGAGEAPGEEVERVYSNVLAGVANTLAPTTTIIFAGHGA